MYFRNKVSIVTIPEEDTLPAYIIPRPEIPGLESV